MRFKTTPQIHCPQWCPQRTNHYNCNVHELAHSQDCHKHRFTSIWIAAVILVQSVRLDPTQPFLTLALHLSVCDECHLQLRITSLPPFSTPRFPCRKQYVTFSHHPPPSRAKGRTGPSYAKAKRRARQHQCQAALPSCPGLFVGDGSSAACVTNSF